MPINYTSDNKVDAIDPENADVLETMPNGDILLNVGKARTAEMTVLTAFISFMTVVLCVLTILLSPYVQLHPANNRPGIQQAYVVLYVLYVIALALQCCFMNTHVFRLGFRRQQVELSLTTLHTFPCVRLMAIPVFWCVASPMFVKFE